MIKNIVKGKQIFSKKATPATEADRQVITDLLDTLRANREICVGMAANCRKQSNYRCSGRTVSVCNGKSRDNKEIRGVSDRGKLPVTRRSQKLYQI